MTRKDFELIAGAVRQTAATVPFDNLAGHVILEQVARALAQALRSTNDRFDRERFVTACLKGTT